MNNQHNFYRSCPCVECKKVKVLIGINSQLEAIYEKLK